MINHFGHLFEKDCRQDTSSEDFYKKSSVRMLVVQFD